MQKGMTSRFLDYLKQRFGSVYDNVEPAATDILRQPRFPGLDAKPKELQPQLPQAPMEDDLFSMLPPSPDITVEGF